MSGFRQQIRFATSADGVRIAYAESGQGSPLVRAGHWMTHLDWDWQTPMWGPLLQSLSKSNHLYRYDLRGCGLSDRDVPTVDLDSVVADLAAVVDAAKLERFALLGVSQGGSVAITYAARYPERVSHLVLLGAACRGALVRAPQQREMREAMVRLVEEGWGQDNAAFRQIFTTLFWPRATREQADSFNEMQRLSSSPAHAARLMRAFAGFDASHLLPQLRCPALVMHCRSDGRVPFEEGRFLAAGIPGARFEPLDSANHLPLAGEPAFDQALRLMAEFVSGGPSGDGPFASLSARERDIVQLIARGLDNAQIGAHLGLAEKTVRNNVSAVFAKLGTENRAQLIVRAREAGFGR